MADATPDTPPADPLAAVNDAVERGDLLEARRLADALAHDADPAVRAKGTAAVAQLGVDPVTAAVLVGTGVLIAVLMGLYLHAH